MKVLEVPSQIYIWNIPNREQLKTEILRTIAERAPSPVKNNAQDITNQDWEHYDWEGEAPYYTLIKPYINNCLHELNDEYVAVNSGLPLTIYNHWFQQYGTGAYHGWHVHSGTTYSSVYYVELPEGASTEFRNASDESFKIPVEEGDFIVFPSHFSHRSAPNYTGKVKTIIAFNLSADAGDY